MCSRFIWILQRSASQPMNAQHYICCVTRITRYTLIVETKTHFIHLTCIIVDMLLSMRYVIVLFDTKIVRNFSDNNEIIAIGKELLLKNRNNDETDGKNTLFVIVFNGWKVLVNEIIERTTQRPDSNLKIPCSVALVIQCVHVLWKPQPLNAHLMTFAPVCANHHGNACVSMC